MRFISFRAVKYCNNICISNLVNTFDLIELNDTIFIICSIPFEIKSINNKTEEILASWNGLPKSPQILSSNKRESQRINKCFYPNIISFNKNLHNPLQIKV